MDEPKEVFARWCFTAPICSYKISSYWNRWLCCTGEEVSFAPLEAEADQFLLLPFDDGRYKLQLVSKSSKSRFLCWNGGSLCCAQRHPECSSDDCLFSLHLHESGRVSFVAGDVFLTTDRNGCVWAAPTSAKKWESFTLFEQALESSPEGPPWNVQAPVRVTLRTSNGKFLCGAKPVVSARAEAPCCCEEFLIDLWFSSLPSPKHEECQPKPRRSFLQTIFGRTVENQAAISDNSLCTIRTADGACLLTAGSDGNIFTTPVDRAQGREAFSIELHADDTCPRISIQQAAAERQYLSAEFGHLVCRRPHRRSCDYFNIQLANGSRVLLKSVHGGFLGAYAGSLRRRSGSCFEDLLAAKGIGAWEVRSHGDSFYTLTSASTMKRGADIYMFADQYGHIHQSSNPRVHFPSVASLFEIKPVYNAGVLPKSSSTSIIGFTIRTIRKIHGKQRYLTVEPNGSLKAVRSRPSRWELFQVIDVDAAAVAKAPQKFLCLPASLNRQPPPTVFSRMSPPINRASETDAETYVKACEVAALAVTEGQAVPRRSSASLQELCITQVCCHTSEGIFEDRITNHKSFCSESKVSTVEDEFWELVSALCSLARSHELLPVSIPSDLTADNAFNIPDDLLTRIWSTCRSRQVPRHSCKWMPSPFVPQSQGPRNRFAARRASASEGWHCSSCDQGNVLAMDPAVNPAHYRYLEVYSRAIQSTGVLWNLISLAGVSIMSTALFFQLKSFAGRRQSSF